MPDKTTAANLMRADAYPLSPGDELFLAARKLLNHRIEGAPVLDDDGYVQGVLTLADVLYKQKDVKTPEPVFFLDALLFWGAGKNNMDEQLHKMTASSVAEAMSSPPITVNPDTPVSHVASLMVDKGLTIIPVVGGDGGLLGVIDRRDVVRFILGRYHSAS
ncbi:MAG: CBS domain-containing protein [Deltaproteobacteria bacterium]|nr:CBS domain-containing protein [Deltaproteobacteria bacterium]